MTSLFATVENMEEMESRGWAVAEPFNALSFL